MRWKSKNVPVIGQLRLLKKFAWHPVNIKGTTVWFERYESIQEYTTIAIDNGICGLQPLDMWIETDRNLL